jgi:hypothetical protein
MLLPNGGSWILEDGPNNVFRTQNQLIISDDLKQIAEVFITDPYLPVQFTYPFSGTYFRPAEVQIPKGTVVAHRYGAPYAKDYDVDFMAPCLTIANGGTTTTVTGPYGSYTRTANVPIGIAFKNCYRRLNDRFKGNYPTITRKSYISLPYFSSNASLAQSMKWGCVYDNAALGGNSVLNMGDHVMSDPNGKVTKWDQSLDTETTQKIGQVIMIDRSIPVQGWLQWVMWEWMSMDAQGMGQWEMFNPYDVNAPLQTPDGSAGDTTGGTSGTTTAQRPDLNAQQNQYPAFYSFNDLVTRFPEQLWDAMGIPGLTDGARMAAVDYSESLGNGTQNSYANGINTITLSHKRVAKDGQGATNPTPDHPFPTKMLVYNNAAATTPLVELVDYYVDRYRGIVYIQTANQTGTETYTITYTSLENQVVGVPSNIDFKGSVGAARIAIDVL